MKILAIRLKNLASLAGEQQVDFTSEPLASAGLFAITGPTGAGKSTLLDALCLALFGETPRLQHARAALKVPDGSDNEALGSDDGRNLLRRGASGGFAEVDFVGVDGKRYRARWEVRRARDKASGKLQNSQQSLRDLDGDQLLATAKREFAEQMEQRLGLNLQQFTRAVLLAQSEFSAFLKADDNQRGELLEKLTDTGVYSRIGKAAYAAAKRAREALEVLEREAGGIRPLAVDERTALEQQHAEAASRLKAEQAALQHLQQQRQWLVERERLQAEQQAAQGQLDAARTAQENLAGERQTLALLEQLAPERHRFARQAELGPLLAGLDSDLQRHGEQQQALQQRLGQLETAASASHAQAQAAEQARQQAAPLLAQAHTEEQRLSELQQELARARQAEQQAHGEATEGERQLTELQARQHALASQQTALAGRLQHSAALHALCAAWDGHRPRLQQAVQLANRLQQGRGELPALEQAAHDAQELRAAAQRQLAELQQRLGGDSPAEQLERLQPQLDAWRPRLHSLDQTQRHWQRREELASGLAAVQAHSAKCQAERERCVANGKAVATQLQGAEQALKLTLELLERQRLARSASVEALRAQLQDGEPCPVCGSAEHPWHHGDALLAALASQDEAEATRAGQQVDELKEQRAGLAAEYKALERQLGEAEQERARIGAELERLDAMLASQTELLAQPVAQRSAWLSGQLAELRQSIQQAEQHQGELLAQQRRSEQLQEQLRATEKADETARQQLEQQRQQLADDQQRLDAELQAFAALLPGDWLSRWQEEPARTFMELDRQVAERLQQLDEQRELSEEHQQRQTVLEQERLRQDQRQQQLQATGERLAELQTRRQQAEANLLQCLGEQPSATAWQHQLEQAESQARATANAAGEALQQARQQQIRLAGEEHNLRQRQQALHTEQTELARELAAWRAGHPQLDDASLAALLARPAGDLALLRAQLKAAEDAVTQGRVRLDERSQQLAAHLAKVSEAPEPAVLEQALDQQHQRCEQAEQQATDLRASLVEDDRRRQQSRELLERIAAAQAEHLRWGRISALIGSADGATFRKIAQGYNLDLLVQHANLQLRQLARRYRLQRGGSALGLLVLDTEMGDELRSVHSLSGGETFLVSLALALGLASMASSKLRIESLFIDEGFGSLDPESLQLAMDALDNLQAQGRKVAVISHVQEMHERIPVQIRVQRQGNGASTLRVVS
ncbi:AAA family ATPase [Pseudomonas oryzae]|uniref:Nuclease SbcCD subunit C n=1 Tax=Pseudomonas oryzae TaxID=1392877 RepID=A0A1H1RX36_9PSED|nr:AAA family ATPase [Pseudomonas oryzae]SDS40245.1 exonuclease SbcC [Pseudomonas oryzae]